MKEQKAPQKAPKSFGAKVLDKTIDWFFEAFAWIILACALVIFLCLGAGFILVSMFLGGPWWAGLLAWWLVGACLAGWHVSLNRRQRQRYARTRWDWVDDLERIIGSWITVWAEIEARLLIL